MTNSTNNGTSNNNTCSGIKAPNRLGFSARHIALLAKWDSETGIVIVGARRELDIYNLCDDTKTLGCSA